MSDEDEDEDEGADRLAAARLELYRPGADDAVRAQYQALRDRAAESAVARPGTYRNDEGGTATDARRARTTTIEVTALLLVVLLGAAAVALVLARTPPRRPVLPIGPPLATAIDRHRSALPAEWRNARIAAASDDLDGATPLHAEGRVLVVVRCPAADRSFQVVSGSRTAYGACGYPAFLQLKDGTSVVVTTRGVVPFSAALLAPDAGS